MVKALYWLPLCGSTLLLAPSLLGQTIGVERAQQLGVQNCDTQCQSVETDCDLACDQVALCVDECKKASEICVQVCRSAPPEASGSAKPPRTPPPAAGSAQAKAAKKPPEKKPPEKKPAAPSKPPAKT